MTLEALIAKANALGLEVNHLGQDPRGWFCILQDRRQSRFFGTALAGRTAAAAAMSVALEEARASAPAHSEDDLLKELLS